MAARAPGPQGQYRQQNGNGQARQQQAPAPKKIDISGTYSDPSEVYRVLEDAGQQFNVIGSIAFGDLPEGFSVMLSTIKVDVANETYDVGMKKRGLGSAAIRRIASAAGVSSISSVCKGWAPNYAAWEVTVARTELDGTVRRETGNRVMDLRDGGSQATAMRDKAIEQNKKYPDNQKDPESQLREQRLHIGAHAESKAWQRAVRTLLGLRTYTADELAKPFAIAKLQFTGRTNDPQLRLMFAQGMMMQALGGMAQLYGASASPAFQLGSGPPPVPQLGACGPVVDIEEDDDVPPPPASPARTVSSLNRASQEGPPTAAPQATTQQRSGPAIDPATFFFKFGREKEVPLCQIQDLAWYEQTLIRDIENPSEEKQRFRARNEAVLEAVRAQMRRNAGEVDDDQIPPDDNDRGDDPNKY